MSIEFSQPDMSTTVLVATGAVTESFTEPIDSFSQAYDSVNGVYTHEQYNAGVWTGVVAGSTVCGDRTHSISSNCANFLSVI